ncbi:MAG TPA: hypothetical protein PLY45_00970 [bacterium]|nr:hypothetical protein [bacterium]
MKKRLVAAAISFMLAAVASGCSGSSTNSAESPNANTGSNALVNRAELIEALWADGSDDAAKSFTAEAGCLASSSFLVKRNFGFSIRMSAEGDGSNLTPSVVVTSINISLSDGEGVVRGAGCPAGDQGYIVTATEELPVDIEASEDAASVKPVDAAAEQAAPYAEGCDVFAHFEKQGGQDCEDMKEDVVGEGGEGEEAAVEEEGCGEGLEERSVKLVVDGVACDAEAK